MIKKICIFGASITFGHNDLEGGGWVDRLKRYLWQGEGASVFNLGISGATTEDLQRRLEHESRPRKPDMILISIGINDCRYVETEGNMQTSLDDFKVNLEELHSQAERVAGTVVFVGLTPIDETKTMPIPWRLGYFYTSENVKKYDSVVEEFCTEKGVRYISMADVVDKDDLPDGLHPNAKGHQKIFERVRDYLIEQKLID